MKKLLNLKFNFKFKLILSFVAVSCGSLISGYIQLNALTKISNTARKMSEVNLVGLTNLSKMDSALKNLQLEAVELSNSKKDSGQIEESVLGIDENLSDFSKFLLMYKSSELSSTETEQITKIMGTLDPLQQKLTKLSQSVTQDIKSATAQIALMDWSQISQEFKNLSSSINVLKSYQNDAGFNLSALIKNDSKKSQLFSLLSISFFFVASVLFGAVLSTVLSKKLAIAAARTRQNVEVLTTASDEMTDASAELSEKVTTQAAALQQSVTALSEISSMIDKVVAESEYTQIESRKSETQAAKGKKSVELILESFRNIHGSTEKLTQEIKINNSKTSEILQTISSISVKTQVINEIVFQTKLLSFNAAVEAARAGEHGKGFSVVAEEIGQLAQMSGQASRDITLIIDESYANVQQILKHSLENSKIYTDEAQNKLDAGLRNGTQSLEILQAILFSSSNVAEHIEMMNTAILEQQKGITEVQKAMHSLGKVSASNQINAEKTRVAAESITAESAAAQLTVQDLEKIVHGYFNEDMKKLAS